MTTQDDSRFRPFGWVEDLCPLRMTHSEFHVHAGKPTNCLCRALGDGSRMPEFVFGKCGVLQCFRGQIAVILCAKRAESAPFKKVISFVFKDSLGSFPLFLYLLAILLTP